MFGLSEIAVLLIIVILLLSARKLPGLARSAGRATRILKTETRAMKADGESPHDGPAPRVIRVTPEKRTDVVHPEGENPSRQGS